MKKSFVELAKKHYDNPFEWHPHEFEEDLKSFGYLKNLLTRYIKGSDNIHLTLNRIIIICNVFTPKGTRELCQEYFEEEYQPILNSYFLFLSIIPAWQVNVNIDHKVFRTLEDTFNNPQTMLQGIPGE